MKISPHRCRKSGFPEPAYADPNSYCVSWGLLWLPGASRKKPPGAFWGPYGTSRGFAGPPGGSWHFQLLEVSEASRDSWGLLGPIGRSLGVSWGLLGSPGASWYFLKNAGNFLGNAAWSPTKGPMTAKVQNASPCLVVYPVLWQCSC
jgi:hypothetical protein